MDNEKPKKLKFFKIRSIRDLNEALKFVYSINMAIGFIVVAFGYLTIRFMPGDSSSLFLFVLLVAFLTLTISFFSIFSFFLAPNNWMGLLSSIDTCRIIVGKERAKTVKNSYKSNLLDETLQDRIRILAWYCIPIFIYFSAIFLPAIFGMEAKTWLTILALIGITCVVGTPILSSKKDHEEKPLQSIKTIDKLVAIFKIIVVSIGSGTLLLVGNIYVFISIYGIHEQQHIIFLLILVVISSGVCLFPPKKSWNPHLWMIVVAFSSTLFIFFIFGFASENSKLDMKALKLVSYGASLEVDSDGCQILAHNQFPIKCEKNTGIYHVDNIDILWRIGEYYLHYQGVDNKEHYLIMPSHILAWSPKPK